MADDPQPLSPEWWIHRLYRRLQAQRDEIDFFNDYYTGNHPLPWLPRQARDEFKRLVEMTRSNYMGLVCDATAERLSVEGFAIGEDPSADEDTWRIWEANSLEDESDKAWLEALIGGVSYFLVAPNPDDRETPNVWVEHGTQAIVEHTPGTNRRERAAGLKVWDDDWTGNVHATLYLPGFIYKFEAEKKTFVQDGISVQDPRLLWTEREVASEQPNGQRSNPLGVVPLIEIPNNPRVLTGGISELYDVTDIQDRVNKTLFDRMQTQEYGIDPQKWAKAFPLTDEDGNPVTIEFGRNRMITTEVAETAFGNFAVAPLAPYSEAKREDVKDIASRTRTPAQYLLGEMSNVNGETLKAAESGLVSKVKNRRRPFGRAASDAMQLARELAGLPTDQKPKPLWTNPEFRTEGELTDAVIKRFQAGLTSKRQAREDVGYTQTQITALEKDDETEPPPPVPGPPARPGTPRPSGTPPEAQETPPTATPPAQG